MRALRLDGDGLRLVHDEPEPLLEVNDARMKVRLAGICQTDLEVVRGYKDFQGILGHEFVAELVEDTGAWHAGQRVVGEINIGCGQCDLCRTGVASQCHQRRALGIVDYPGAFADQMRLPIHNLHAVPDSIPDEVAVFTEPLAAALQILECVPIQPSQRVVLIGAGKLGLLCAQVLKQIGCELIVLARQARSLACLSAWGIEAVDLRKVAWETRIAPVSADVVVDCTGNAEGFAAALDIVRPRGTILLKSTYADVPVANLTRIVVDELRVIGSRCGPFAPALRLLASGAVDVRTMTERIYPLDEAETAFDHAAGRGVLKVLLRP